MSALVRVAAGPASLVRQKSLDQTERFFRAFFLRRMAGVRQYLEGGVGKVKCQALPDAQRDNLILLAPQYQRGHTQFTVHLRKLLDVGGQDLSSSAQQGTLGARASHGLGVSLDCFVFDQAIVVVGQFHDGTYLSCLRDEMHQEWAEDR